MPALLLYGCFLFLYFVTRPGKTWEQNGKIFRQMWHSCQARKLLFQTFNTLIQNYHSTYIKSTQESSYHQQLIKLRKTLHQIWPTSSPLSFTLNVTAVTLTGSGDSYPSPLYINKVAQERGWNIYESPL